MSSEDDGNSTNDQVTTDYALAMRLQHDENTVPNIDLVSNNNLINTFNALSNIIIPHQNNDNNQQNIISHQNNDNNQQPILNHSLINMISNIGGHNITYQIGGQSLHNIGSIFNQILEDPVDMEDVILVIKDDVLAKLEVNLYKVLKKKSDETLCSICTDEFYDEDIVRFLPCKHVYHRVCIDIWLKTKSYKCPSCRKECGQYKILN